ncbi:heparinase [Salinivibrio proteolyticus]|uniref:heparinase II/III family protein n=1 Tax=Salinivibrio proteolyticus TaxID=334715 RepID=UPI000988EB73|nr:heparinase II/III-family protein [Salinivibrio proteolyticus]OOF21180.1 heparinase [Salinivibrio proteolyticus]
MKFKLIIKIAKDLGLLNLARVAFYKASVSSGLNSLKKIQYAPISGDFFRAAPIANQGDNQQQEYMFSPFGWMPEISITDLKWDLNVLTGKSYPRMNKPWYCLADFDSNVGDIKGIWEASRFGWLIGLARDYHLGRRQALDELNETINSWLDHNPPYLGPNWKCGQEASIRVMHAAVAAKLLNQIKSPEPALLNFVKAHLERIAPTISYAIAQDNNHGTSEAAALFIGGTWLVANGDEDAMRWEKMGRKWLENRANHLIAGDGTFSQYSVNYHRVMLDTYSISELWRRKLDLESFSPFLYRKMGLATRWLYQLTQEVNGDAPNLGHNDGAKLLPLCDSDYRDFRPAVQLASVVFLKSSAWREAGSYDEPLKLLGLSKPQQILGKPRSFHFSQGGYVGLRSTTGAFVLFNYPIFRFRPAQNDALHVDFWLNGVNLLRDGGTFSYNAGQAYLDYYGGTQSHNTIQFDDHEQMPRLSRFLLGSWLKAEGVYCDQSRRRCGASYRDYFKCRHHREVSLSEKALRVVDDIQGVQKKAILRWRLSPGEWVIEGNRITNHTHAITIDSNVDVKRLELVEGKESRYYYQETSIPVLEIEVVSDGKITTEYKYR